MERSSLLVVMAAVAAALAPGVVRAQPAGEPVILADFEQADYGQWKAEGRAFGKGPVAGTLPHQQPVSGFSGKGLVNSYQGGDGPTGTLTSPPFTIQRRHLVFLIGGGGHAGQTCLDLLVEGKVVASACGRNNETLDWASFDLEAWKGKSARIRIVDNHQGGWGHVLVDQISQSDRPRGEVVSAEEEVSPEAARQLLDAGVEQIVFTVRRVDGDGHWYANFSYWVNSPDRKMYHEGGQLAVLDVRSGKVRLLIDDPKGGVRDPQVHYDGRKILFSYRPGGREQYHLHEINVDGTGLRKITDGPQDDIEPIYLPGGDILFCSSRCNRFVNCYYVRVAVIHRCGPDGQDVRPLSANIEHDNTPWLLPDGRVLYMRWEYIDRSQVAYHHLWTMNPDGTNQMVYYGNQMTFTVMLDAKPIPGTSRVVASFSPGHGRHEHSGYITVVDPSAGPDEKASARRLSDRFYRDPYPLSEDLFLVAGDCRGPAPNDAGHCLYTLDGQGRQRLLHRLGAHRAAAGFKVHEPRPVRPRMRERETPVRTDWSQNAGRVFVADLYQGRNMEGIQRGQVRKLLVLEALPKPVNFSGGWEPLTYGGSFTLERVVGTVPVEEDGSAYLELPALRSLFFVLLDEQDLCIKRMQSFVSVMPGETFGCVGCHEQRTRTLQPPRALAAMRRPPSRIQPVLDVPDVIDFPRDVQPILDRHCVACHDYDKTPRGGPRSGGVILSGDRGPMYSHSYYMLTVKEQFADGRNQARSNYAPRTLGSSASALMKKLDGAHHGVKVSPREKAIVRLWIDSAAAYPGTYASLGSGMVHGDGWDKSAGPAVQRRCAACHAGKRMLPPRPGHDMGIGTSGQVPRGDARLRMMPHAVMNLTRPRKSLMLLAPLAGSAGGYGLCRPAAALPAGPGQAPPAQPPPVFASVDDPDYKAILEGLEAAKAELDRIKRFDMPGFRPNVHYLREMQLYGVLPRTLKETDPVDPYQTDRAYWMSLWVKPVGGK